MPEKAVEEEIDAVARLEYEDRIAQLTRMMKKAARELDFEKAARLRDEVSRLKKTIKGK